MSYVNKVIHNKFLLPRYWLAWCGVGLLWLIAKLPYRVQISLGRCVGYLMRICASKLRHTTQVNIQLCFPELNPQQQTSLLKNAFNAAGIGLVETAAAWWGSATSVKKLAHFSGWEHLDRALQHGKGVIVLCSHFTPIELIGRLMSLHRDFAAMYNPHKKPFLAMLRQYVHEQHYHIAMPREDLRTLIKCLRKNLPVLYAPDIDAGAKNSVFVSFMGVKAATVTATARLARATGAKVVPASYFRRDDLRGYDITFYPALENFPTEDDAADAQRQNQIIESFVKQKPEQYLWQYKRFKTRPNGEKRFYSNK